MRRISRQDTISVTPKAARLMNDYFKDKQEQPVRIFVRLGGCGIRTFGIAQEPPKSSDRLFKIEGTTYIINKKLLNLVAPITVDSDGINFLLSGRGVAPAYGCGNCSNMCGIRGGNRCPGECPTCQLKCGLGSRQRRHA